ncbi:hypothetical protein ACHAWO_005189 [Cyclotella atomus]|uniref:Uncharacterized protein n=1 Tax=Cyclotella atomus TaxID=382360 RepID=A0ABD3PCJ0_9STRA
MGRFAIRGSSSIASSIDTSSEASLKSFPSCSACKAALILFQCFKEYQSIGPGQLLYQAASFMSLLFSREH